MSAFAVSVGRGPEVVARECSSCARISESGKVPTHRQRAVIKADTNDTWRSVPNVARVPAFVCR
jgi:hypothetical protein